MTSYDQITWSGTDFVRLELSVFSIIGYLVYSSIVSAFISASR